MIRGPGFLIRESAPGFVVWDGYPSRIVPESEACFVVNDIVGYGTTREAADAIVRLLSASTPKRSNDTR